MSAMNGNPMNQRKSSRTHIKRSLGNEYIDPTTSRSLKSSTLQQMPMRTRIADETRHRLSHNQPTTSNSSIILQRIADTVRRDVLQDVKDEIEEEEEEIIVDGEVDDDFMYHETEETVVTSFPESHMHPSTPRVHEPEASSWTTRRPVNNTSRQRPGYSNSSHGNASFGQNFPYGSDRSVQEREVNHFEAEIEERHRRSLLSNNHRNMIGRMPSRNPCMNGSHPFQSSGSFSAPAQFNQGLRSNFKSVPVSSRDTPRYGLPPGKRPTGPRVPPYAYHQARDVTRLPVKVLTREDVIAAAMKRQQEQLAAQAMAQANRAPKEEIVEQKPEVPLIVPKEEIEYTEIKEPKVEIEEEEIKPEPVLSTEEKKPDASLLTEETKPEVALLTEETKPTDRLTSSTSPVSNVTRIVVNGTVPRPISAPSSSSPVPLRQFTARTYVLPGSNQTVIVRNENPSVVLRERTMVRNNPTPPIVRKVILAPPNGLVQRPQIAQRYVEHQQNQAIQPIRRVTIVKAPVNGIVRQNMCSTSRPNVVMPQVVNIIDNREVKLEHQGGTSSSASVPAKCSFNFRVNGNFRMSSNPVAHYHNRFPIPRTRKFCEDDFIPFIEEEKETEKTKIRIEDDHKYIANAFNSVRYILQKTSDPSKPSKPVKVSLDDRLMFSEEYLRKLFTENPKKVEFDWAGTVFDASDVIECHLCRYVMRLCVRKSTRPGQLQVHPAYRCLRRGCQTYRSLRSKFGNEKRQPYGKRKPKNDGDGPEEEDSEDKIKESIPPKPKKGRFRRSRRYNQLAKYYYSGSVEGQPIRPEDFEKFENDLPREPSEESQPPEPPSDQDEDDGDSSDSFVEYEDPFESDVPDEESFQKRLDYANRDSSGTSQEPSQEKEVKTEDGLIDEPVDRINLF